MEAFMAAVLENDIDPHSDEELLNLFCDLANHRNATPLVNDWVVVLYEECDR